MTKRIITIGESGDGDYEKRQLLTVKQSRLSDEVMTSEALSKFPDLCGLDSRDLIVMMAVAHGFSYRMIQSATGLAPSTICDIVKRVDPCGRYRLDDDGMKAFVAKRARAKTAEVLGMMDVDRMDECSPVQQAKIAKTLSEVSAMQERKDLGSLGGKGIKKVTVEFVDEIDEAKPISEVVEEEAY